MMMRIQFLFAFSFLFLLNGYAQKKPLDHTVYDEWQSIGQKLISNDGKWTVYSIDRQEGDNELVVQSLLPGNEYQKIIPRGYNAEITEDSRFVIFRIKPFYQDTRQARIKKKKPDEMPKDSMGIIELGKDSVLKLARLSGFKTPAKSSGWLAYQLDIKKEEPKKKSATATADTKLITDSLRRVIDSLQALIPKKKKSRGRDDEDFTVANNGDGDYGFMDADDDDASAGSEEKSMDLWLRNLETGNEKLFRNISEYVFSRNGKKLLMKQARDAKDSLSQPAVLLYDLHKGYADTISRGGNVFKNFAFSDDGSQLAFIAERDAKPKDLQKYYRLWYFKDGMDSAIALVDRNTVNMKLGMVPSEHSTPEFSKSGKRLFFGTVPIQAPKDTSLVDIDLVKLDIWHYNEDYLQTVQLSRLSRDLRQSLLAVYDLENGRVQQLASEKIPQIFQTNEGDGDIFYAATDFGKRVESQWAGNTKKDLYAIDVKTGTTKLIKENVQGFVSPTFVSPTGKYLLWYDSKARHYFVYDGKDVRNITSKIKLPLYNEEHDSPGDPSPYGVMRWQDDESAVYIYERYGVWKVDPTGVKAPDKFIDGRKEKIGYRYVQTNSEERSVKAEQTLVFRSFNDVNKRSGLWEYQWTGDKYVMFPVSADSSVNLSAVSKAKDSNTYLFTKETYYRSPDLYSARLEDGNKNSYEVAKLSAINPQQANYNWGTAELYKWKTFAGKSAEGILYKPEDFDPSKKYPLILYFYERLSDGLYNYHAPAPTPSRLNISFFVSRGYLVFAPDIHYTIGHPAKSAYDFIVSGAKSLTKFRWVDSKNIGIQGQSWGGIQVAQLITMTDMFKAAWAGAPVANMTSAYGGIRWESGSNRQFQYEKTQSRLGATLWEKPSLYIENSPLFHLPKVKTPLVIMHNDADGAVPWYQGIELFTGMRRLGKKVWMLNYNGEAHNLVQRKNRKDIQIREQQYFDWLLKGEKPAKWIVEGVPAVKKGKDWGLEIVD